MLERLLQYYRVRKRAVAERELVHRLTSDLLGYRSIAALLYPATEYVSDPEANARVQALKLAVGDRLRLVATPDPEWKPGSFAGLPVSALDEMASSGIECVVIPSTQFAEVLFYLFNNSNARQLAVVAPALHGVPHRLFLRRELMRRMAFTSTPQVLEVGSIEHPLGGHRTTQALAETLWGQGSLTTIDINPFTLQLAALYCAGTRTRVTYIAGDCRDVLRNADKSAIDFVLLHFMSDNSAVCIPLIEAFDLIEPRLTSGTPVVFQSVTTGDAQPGSLQMHLRGKGYECVVTPIAGNSKPPRFFIVATRS